ncbi:sugar ABC transporter binding protein [Bifidobacterium actinocoloniiforme DSM 22766]|uniref:Sugar ABC transporter binding protein n=2 Tax=Bifidobacterium actinocoloniiforme TaxID=638619 RepID=A0A086Z0E5_9BIFI|nr:sugar ABC transporter binding protein [Bifidobacterium actinocoloniiforme DSM 22766]
MRKAITYTSNLFKEGIADVNADTSAGTNMAAFASGKTSMMMEGFTAIGQVEQVGGPDMGNKFTTAPLPKGEKESVSYSGGRDMVVFKDSKNKDAAWKMTKWMSKPETQAKWYKLSADLPTSSKAWEDPELKNDEKLTSFAIQMKSMKATPSVITCAQVSASVDKIMEQINKGAFSVDNGLEQFQSEAESAGMGN